MTWQEIIDAWNAKADEWNQWESIGEDEKVEFAYSLGREDALNEVVATFFNEVTATFFEEV